MSKLNKTSCASNDRFANPEPVTEYGLCFAMVGSRKATGKVEDNAARQVPMLARCEVISVLMNFLARVSWRSVPMMYRLSRIL